MRASLKFTGCRAHCVLPVTEVQILGCIQVRRLWNRLTLLGLPFHRERDRGTAIRIRCSEIVSRSQIRHQRRRVVALDNYKRLIE